MCGQTAPGSGQFWWLTLRESVGIVAKSACGLEAVHAIRLWIVDRGLIAGAGGIACIAAIPHEIRGPLKPIHCANMPERGGLVDFVLIRIELPATFRILLRVVLALSELTRGADRSIPKAHPFTVNSESAD